MTRFRFFTLLFICVASSHAQTIFAKSFVKESQVTITPGPVTFQLPPRWIQGPQQELSNGGFVGVFGRPLVDEEGNEIIPACSFLAEKTDITDLVLYSLNWRIRSPAIEIELVIVPENGVFTLPKALAYKGRINDEKKGAMLAIVLHAIDESSGTGLLVSCEAPPTLFSQVEEDFLTVFGSIKFIP